MPLLSPLLAATVDRIDPVGDELPRLARPLARTGEAEGVKAAEAHVALAPAGGAVAEDSGASGVATDLEVEAAAVGIHAGRLEARDLKRRQPSDFRHGVELSSKLSHPRRYPRSYARRYDTRVTRWLRSGNARCPLAAGISDTL